jgi:hypothetical protein
MLTRTYNIGMSYQLLFTILTISILNSVNIDTFIVAILARLVYIQAFDAQANKPQ